MDSVFVWTQDFPKNISDKEMVLSQPTFIAEIKACERKRGSAPTIGHNYLRAIAEEIGRRYDRFFNPYRNVVPHDFAGRICESDEDVALAVHEMFQARYPVIYQKYYETMLRSRPFTTKVIYFSGSKEDFVVFQKLGIREISLEEVPDHLGAPRKSKPQSVVKKVDKSIFNSRVQAVEEFKPQAAEEIQHKESAPIDSNNSDVLEKLASLPESTIAQVSLKEETPPEQIKPTNQHQHNKNQNRLHHKSPQSIKTPNV